MFPLNQQKGWQARNLKEEIAMTIQEALREGITKRGAGNFSLTRGADPCAVWDSESPSWKLNQEEILATDWRVIEDE